MAVISTGAGTHFRAGSSFAPNAMVDTLFDYRAFLAATDAAGGIGSVSGGPVSIAVVGSGAAGLSAALELAKIPNVNVDVYEASGRLGGRMDSIAISDPGFNDKIFELGCMRFPPTSHTLFHYLNQFGLKPSGAFPDPGTVDTRLFYKNQVIEWPAGSDSPDQPDFQRIGKDFGAMLSHILGDVKAPNTTNPTKLVDYWSTYQSDPTPQARAAVAAAWQAIIDLYKDETYYRAVWLLAQDTSVVAQAWDQEDMYKFGALGVGSGGFGPLYEVNFVEILRLFANGWESGQQLLLSGIVSVVDGFEAGLQAAGATVTLNTPIGGVSQAVSGGYTLQLPDGSSSGNYNAVIVATTTRAMEFMGLTLAPDNITSTNAKVALRKLHLMNSSKLFVTTRTKFWYSANNGGKGLPSNIQTDESLRGLYCLDYDPPLHDSNNEPVPNTGGKGVVLVSYVWGDDSSKLLALNAEDRFDAFLATLEQVDATFAEELRSQAENLQIVDWENEPHYFGAFKLNYPGQEQSCRDAFFQYQDNSGVILAGDSVSWAGGWVEGALTSGVNAACAALAHVGGTVAADSPLTIPQDLYVYNNPPIGEAAD